MTPNQMLYQLRGWWYDVLHPFVPLPVFSESPYIPNLAYWPDPNESDWTSQRWPYQCWSEGAD